jgi:hypothetical protein
MKTLDTQACASTPKGKARNTFGIAGYDDIVSAHLQARYLSIDDLKNGYLTESADRGKQYQLLLDYKAEKALREKQATQETPETPEIIVLVSFQIRKDGCYAVARMWEPDKQTNKTEKEML